MNQKEWEAFLAAEERRLRGLPEPPPAPVEEAAPTFGLKKANLSGDEAPAAPEAPPPPPPEAPLFPPAPEGTPTFSFKKKLMGTEAGAPTLTPGSTMGGSSYKFDSVNPSSSEDPAQQSQPSSNELPKNGQ